MKRSTFYMIMITVQMLILLGCAMLYIHQANAQLVTSDIGANAVWNWNTGNVYQIHQVHVGDRIYVTNTDSKIHSIRGSDNAGEIFQSSAMYPGQQFEMTFLFPGNFTFYDEYNGHNFGLIQIYNPGAGFPPITNYTADRSVYQGSVTYSNLADNSSMTSDPSPTLSFTGTSNATFLFSDSNATVSDPPTFTSQNNTAAYWESQSNMWENKYNNLLSELSFLKAILG